MGQLLFRSNGGHEDLVLQGDLSLRLQGIGKPAEFMPWADPMGGLTTSEVLEVRTEGTFIIIKTKNSVYTLCPDRRDPKKLALTLKLR